MTVGSPGGSTIITSVLQTILNVRIQLACRKRLTPPIHHQWLPDLITFEPNTFNTQTFDTLKAKGYLIDEKQLLLLVRWMLS
jgi:gamma-glutamyltranspeptidase/glutathione hydrolase